MKRIHSLSLITVSLVLISIGAQSQDFVYTPKNPAFGGNYFNYQWMLSSANAQNTIQQTSTSSYRGYEYDPFANFEQDIQRRFFSELSSKIIGNYFGEGTDSEQLEEGTYQFGNYKIDITPGQQGIDIRIQDYSKGSESMITIPYY